MTLVPKVAELLKDPAPASQFAVELYCYRLRKYIGAFCAVLGGCDGIVFGASVLIGSGHKAAA